jgi:hypothetical protein
MQKTVAFLDYKPSINSSNDAFECQFKFSVIDSALIGTPRQNESIHTIKVQMSDFLMSSWGLPGFKGFSVTEAMIKIAFQSVEEHITEQLKKGSLQEGELAPLIMTTANSPKSCPYNLSNIPYPKKLLLRLTLPKWMLC